MKTIIQSMFRVLPAVALILLAGCEYDVAEPLWNQTHEETSVPEIIRIVPADVAVAGTNTIMLEGVHFGDSIELNDVYFDNVEAEVVSASSTQITVRRPNLVAEACTVKVAPHDALVFASHSPYGIDPVMAYYGDFLEGTELGAAAVDAAENLYVFQRTSPASVVKVTADGERRMFNEELDRAVTDAVLAPDGSMVLLRNNRDLTKLNLQTGEEAEWIGLSKSVSYGDFDASGNLYAGGRRSDLFVVPPDESASQIGEWARDEILWVRVSGNYVYLLVDIASPDEANPDMSIWRHSIDGAGNVGARELVLNWTETGEYEASLPYCFAATEDGWLLVGTDYEHPILMVDPATGALDVLYKDILPSPAVALVRGNANYAYMILGGETFNVVRIDLGSGNAPR